MSCMIALVLIVLSQVLTHRIEVEDQVNTESALNLTFKGANRDVKYKALTLPSGFELKDGRIMLEKTNDGIYPAQIWAQYSAGNVDKAKFTIEVRTKNDSKNQLKTLSISSRNSFHQLQSNNEEKTNPSSSKVPISENLNKQIANSSSITRNDRGRSQHSINQGFNQQSQPQPNYDEINKIITSLNFTNNAPIQKGMAIKKQQQDKRQNNSNLEQNRLTKAIIKTQNVPRTFSLLRDSKAQQNQLYLNKVFNRQIDAAKVIANQLSIIQKIKSIRSQALIQIAKGSQIYEKSQQNQISTKNLLLMTQSIYSQKYQTLKNITGQLKKAKDRKQQLQDSILNTKKSKEEQIMFILTSQDKTEFLKSQINQAKNQLNQLILKKDQNKSGCLILDKKLRKAQDLKESKYDQIVEMRMKLVPARRELQMGIQYINAIKDQLAKAEKSVRESKFVVQYYQNQYKILNDSLKYIQQQVNSTKFLSDQCQSNLQSLNEEILIFQRTKVSKIQSQRVKIDSQIQKKANELSKSNTDIQTFSKQLQQIKKKIPQWQTNSMNIQKQLSDLQLKVFALRGLESDRTNEVQRARKSFQVSSKLFLESQKSFQVAIIRLQQARTQKQIADQTINQLLHQKSSINLFSISPPQLTKEPESQNSQNVALTVFKPQESLEQRSIEQKLYISTNKNGSYSIKNMPEFIFYYFGSSVKAPIINSTRLYPLKTYFNPNQISTQGLALISLQGYAISIKSNSFIMLTDQGLIFQVQFGSILKGFSLQPNTILEIGSKIILKGFIIEDRRLLASVILCLNP